MKRLLSVFVMAFLFMALLGLEGCGGNKETGRQSTGDQPSVSQDNGKSAKEESVTDLLARGKQVTGMSYEYTLTGTGETMRGQVWIEGKKMKNEGIINGQRVISIFDADTNTVITYYPDQNKAIKLSAEKSNKPAETPGDYAGDVDAGRANILEATVYDGVRCKVVAVQGADGNEQMKMWVREDYGLPMRVEVTAADSGKTVMEYKNLQVGPLSPGIFELPAGVEVTDMNKMLKQMPQSPQMPTGRP